MLVSSLGLSAAASLLPNLRSLSLDLSAADTTGSWVPKILPLVSPTLQHIFYVSSSTHVPGVESFQNILKSRRSLEFTSLAYRGYPSPNLLQRCLLFEGLKSLSLEFNFEEQNIQRYAESSVAVVDIFQTLVSLQDLKVDLRVFPLRMLESDPKPRVLLYCVTFALQEMLTTCKSSCWSVSILLHYFPFLCWLLGLRG